MGRRCSNTTYRASKLNDHKEDFAVYMTKRLGGNLSSPTFFNPLRVRLAHEADHYRLTSHRTYGKHNGNWAVLGKYTQANYEDHGLGIFNPYHSFDQLDHPNIDKAMSGYAAGSDMFWALFVLDCLCVIGEDTDEVRARATLWRVEMTLLPITMHFVDTAEQLALQYARGSAGPGGKGSVL